MQEVIHALFVEAHPQSLDTLCGALEEESVNVYTAGNCAGAALALWGERPPHLVFTDVQLADGNWADVLTLASKASAAVNVVVVAPFPDVRFYVQVIERGAFDFITPPFVRVEMQHVVRTALENVRLRRRQAVRSAPPTLVAVSTTGGAGFDPVL